MAESVSPRFTVYVLADEELDELDDEELEELEDELVDFAEDEDELPESFNF